jgi:hypothetical protein
MILEVLPILILVGACTSLLFQLHQMRKLWVAARDREKKYSDLADTWRRLSVEWQEKAEKWEKLFGQISSANSKNEDTVKSLIRTVNIYKDIVGDPSTADASALEVDPKQDRMTDAEIDKVDSWV